MKDQYKEDKEKLIQAFQTIRIILSCGSVNLTAAVTALQHYVMSSPIDRQYLLDCIHYLGEEAYDTKVD